MKSAWPVKSRQMSIKCGQKYALNHWAIQPTKILANIKLKHFKRKIVDGYCWNFLNKRIGFIPDMAVQNCIGDAFRGATWVALHNGGGVGWWVLSTDFCKVNRKGKACLCCGLPLISKVTTSIGLTSQLDRNAKIWTFLKKLSTEFSIWDRGFHFCLLYTIIAI